MVIPNMNYDKPMFFIMPLFGIFVKAGRLLIRGCINEILGIPWQEIKLDRTEKSKPFLVTIFIYNILSSIIFYTIYIPGFGVTLMRLALPGS